MALMRFSLDLAIPKAVYDAIPTTKKTAFRDMVRELKALAVKINDQEMAVKARYHVCHHDDGTPCEQELEI